MLDLAFRNVQILDGTGAAAFSGDVGVVDGRIAEVGDVGAARRDLDGAGACLAPGFIDTHAHDDGAFLRHPDMGFKLAQGVTSVVSGNCGFSAAPADPAVNAAAASGGILAGLTGDFTDLAGYFDAVLARKPAINNMMLVGHNTIRAMTMGMEKREPTTAELATMRGHVELAMEQGACGFSSGLIYRPGRYSLTAEVADIAAAVAPYNGLYATHMRNEGDRLLEAVDESLSIAREADVHLHISHHKSAGKPNWGKVGDSLAKVDAALQAGQRVTLDVYPYTAGSGRMIEYFNLDRINTEFAEVVRIASCPAFREFEGKMVTEIASERGISVDDAVRLILTAEKGERTICIHFIIDEADIETNLAHTDMMVGSDGIPDLRGRPHPRLFGTFPRVLSRYVRERGVLTLPEAVRRMTSLAARTFGLQERGEIRPGWCADLVLFNPKTVTDEATYDDPKREPSGVSAVVVNGHLAYQDGQHLGVGSGEMLRFRRGSHSTR